MADWLKTGSDWLEAQRRANATQTVTYSRAAAPLSPITLAATLGRTVFDMEQADGAVLRVEARDFLITAADLGAEPAAGDTILYALHTYKVMPFGSEPAWRYCDPYRVTYRVHTKEVDVP